MPTTNPTKADKSRQKPTRRNQTGTDKHRQGSLEPSVSVGVGAADRTDKGTKLIPASHALIGAVTVGYRQVVRVVVLRDGVAARRSQDWKTCRYTMGACCADWMTDQSMTPEWVFSELMIAHGFATSAVAEQAIAEFAKIKECGWARAMMASVPQAKPSWVVA